MVSRVWLTSRPIRIGKGVFAEAILSWHGPKAYQAFMVGAVLVPYSPDVAYVAAATPPSGHHTNLGHFDLAGCGDRHQPENDDPNDSTAAAVEDATRLASVLRICPGYAGGPCASSVAHRGTQRSHPRNVGTVSLGC